MPDGEWLDVTVPLSNGVTHYPHNPPLAVSAVYTHAEHQVALSRLELGSHTGTHVDAPLHFIEGGAGIDEMPPEAMIGPARVADVGEAKIVGRRELERIEPRPGERLLLRTRNSRRAWWREEFDPEYVALDEEAAALLASRKVRLVGLDYLSIAAGSADATKVHQTLLGADVWVLEGLDLTRATAGKWDLFALPLRIEGCDGAPARVLLRRPGGRGTGL